MRDTVESHRALHIRVKGDPHTSRSLDFTTTWFFVRGLEGRVDSLPTGGTRGWRRAYRQTLTDECDLLAGELAPATVHVTILWRDGEFNEHLAEVLRSLDDSLHDSFQPVFVTDAPAACESLAEEFDAPVIEMPLHQFASGVQQLFDEKPQSAPTRSRFHLGPVYPSNWSPVWRIGSQRKSSWCHWECRLQKMSTLSSAVARPLGQTSTATSTLVEMSRRGSPRQSDGTWMPGALPESTYSIVPARAEQLWGRRAAWELHEEFPCGLLRRTVPMVTADRVARIHELTDRPVFLIADGTDIAERELDELAEYLGARRTPVVLVQVRRRQEPAKQQGDRSFDLDSKLSIREVGRFIYTLSQDALDRAVAIERLGRPDSRELHRPVYFALTAYERDFRALPDFVSSRIAGLNDDQKRVVVYAAIALRYGQRALPASALRSIFGLSPANGSIFLPCYHRLPTNCSSRHPRESGESVTLW